MNLTCCQKELMGVDIYALNLTFMELEFM